MNLHRAQSSALGTSALLAEEVLDFARNRLRLVAALFAGVVALILLLYLTLVQATFQAIAPAYGGTLGPMAARFGHAQRVDHGTVRPTQARPDALSRPNSQAEG